MLAKMDALNNSSEDDSSSDTSSSSSEDDEEDDFEYGLESIHGFIGQDFDYLRNRRSNSYDIPAKYSKTYIAPPNIQF